MTTDDNLGTVILVTGASGAIGFEIAAQAAESGALVGVHGSASASVNRTIAALRQRVPEGRFEGAPANYDEPGAVKAMVDGFAERASRIDAVIDCAIQSGKVSIVGPLAALDPAAFQQLCATASAFQTLCHAVYPHLARSGGAIVAFASDSGRFAAARQSVVGAKQAAIIGFVRNIALEYARDSVRVNCISPSFVLETRLFEQFHKSAEGRAERARTRAGLGLPTPRDIAPLALFLAGPGATKITGQVISVNGGLNA